MLMMMHVTDNVSCTFSDRVMVLDAGQIAEFASPTELFGDTGSIFYGMCKAAGITSIHQESSEA